MSAALPGKDALLAACRGFPQAVDHPVLSAAAELAVLHQTRERTPHSGLAVIDAHRVRLMESVDTWVSISIPRPMSSARVHTQTMGQVIDRIAQLTSYTYTVIAGGSDEVFADAAANVDELAHGYEDLAEELIAGVRRLPVTSTEP
ncbi:DUF4254 domain-containing protein [Nocardia sp. NPDC005366]|uniref:DUF4254 domain-containing protein n=1 Tax=Nocardia sp. NPDC005366 TaxID=3156878 RepID=UPI0033BD41ED